MERKRVSAVFIAVIAAAIVAGCGSGGSGDEVTASSITKPEYIKRADAICQSRNRELENRLAVYLKKTKLNYSSATEAQYVALVETLYIPALKKEITAIRALGAPKGDEDEVTELVAAREENLETAEEKPSEIADAAPIVFQESNKLAKEYGLTACEQGE